MMREAIVLAGGFGTRLRQILPDLPKPMAPIAGHPFLEIVLRSLATKGFGRIVLSLGYMAEKISGHFGSSFAGLDLTYVVEEQALGTGGGVRLAMTQCQEDHVFIFNGDTFLDLDVEAIEQHWQRYRRPIIVGRKVPDTARYGRLLASGGHVTGFSEKGVPGEGLINAGCYIFNRGQLDLFPSNTPFSLEIEYLANAVHQMCFDLFETEGKFIDIGVPEDFARAQKELEGFLLNNQVSD